MALVIHTDSNGCYYNVTNRYDCWGAAQSYWNNRYECDEPHMLNNATKIFNQLRYWGWDKRSACAVIGNMCAESYLNAAQTQHGYTIGDNNGGYGLVMWTPQTNYRDWARTNDHDPVLAYWQTYCIDTLENVPDQWDETEYNMTYAEFKTNPNNYSVEYMTMVFYYSYEKGSEPAMAYRVHCANWYATYFFNYDPEDPSQPDPPMPPPSPLDPPSEPYKRYGLRKRMPIWMYPVIRQRR